MSVSVHRQLADTARRFALVLLVLATAPLATAQVDSDGDGVANDLELAGFRFDINSGNPVACNPATDSPCYVTDPLAWSSDGDPYSDFQEASGVNMDASVEAPYNSPLVAAYPVIEVVLDTYRFTSNATISDSNGETLSAGQSFTSSTQSTAAASVSVGTSYNPLDGFGLSAEASASYSETRAYTNETTSGTEINWETATSTELNNAGTLSLALFARNTGGATALDVRPTFNVYIGEDLLATVLPDEPFRLSLAPGESSASVVPMISGAPLGLTLTFDQLVALQSGAPVTIEVVDILANIQRWRPNDSNWACGSGDTCTWTSFQNQIEPRTLRLLVDFGYSGDPGANVPARFRGNPFEYRVYTGSPNTDPGFTLRDVLELAGFDVTGSGGSLSIEGRPYPTSWALAEQPGGGGQTPIQNAWQAAGEPRNLIDVTMPRQATLFMTSPDPADPGAGVRLATVTRDFLHVRAVAAPRGGLPITSASATVEQNGVRVDVPLRLALNGAYWTTEGTDAALDAAIGLASTSVEFVDVSGARQRSTGLALPVTQATSCASVPPEDLVNTNEAGGPVGDGGRATLFPDGNLDRPVEVYCERGSDVTRHWVPQPVPGTTSRLEGVAMLDDGALLASGRGIIVRSEDGGRTWTDISIPEPATRSVVWWGLETRSGTETAIAFGHVDQAGYLLRSIDGGQTWTNIPGPVAGKYVPLTGVAHAGGNVWYAIGGFRGITRMDFYRSTDDGRSWTLVSLPFSITEFEDVAFKDANTGLLLDNGAGGAGAGQVYRTTNGGDSWTPVLRSHNTTDIEFAGGSTWYIPGAWGDTGGRILRSTDDGQTWTNIVIPEITDGGRFGVFNSSFSTPEVGYLAVKQGILKTTDAGDTWSLDPAFPGKLTRSVRAIDTNRAIAVGEPEQGENEPPFILLTTSGGTGSVIVSNEEPAEPIASSSRVTLEPNAPNPFRDRTTVVYTLDAPGDVELAIYDLLGREVARLVDAPQAAGEHRVAFEARGMAPGVYVARLVMGGEVATRRMTLVR
ncbi:MAG: binary toxin-like calcium binding domain-containing protein [Bacteroidota bacterium]